MSSLVKKLAIGGTLGVAAYIVLSSKKVKDLKGKSVLITGAAGGLGRCVCLELAKKKEVVSMTLWDIQLDELKKTEKLIKSLHPDCTVFVQKVNLADRGSIYAAADECTNNLSGKAPYLVVNNAGVIAGSEGCLNTDDSRIELEMKVNALAHVWMAKAFIPKMSASAEGGHFMNVASMAGYVGSGDMTTYAMSKKAAKGFAEALNAEMKLKGLNNKIKVSVLCPGHIQTALFEGFQTDGISMTPEFVAKKLVEAVEKERGITVLPPMIGFVPAIVGLVESMGYLNLPTINKSYNPMSNWKSGHTNKLFSQMESK